MDVGKDTTERDHSQAISAATEETMIDEIVELLVIGDSELEVARDDTSALAISRGIASELEDLCYEVLDSSSEIDTSTCTLASTTVDMEVELLANAKNGELETSASRLHVPALLAIHCVTTHLSRVVLGHCLGALSYSVLSELTRKRKTHSGLYLDGGDGSLVRDHVQYGSNLLNEGMNDGINNRHGLVADASVWVHLLEHLEYVALVGALTTTGLTLLGGCLG